MKLIRLAMISSGNRKSHDLTKAEMGGSSYAHGQSQEPLWKRYLGEKDRDHMRLPIFNLTWMPSIPFVRKKIDTIHHCWQEMARLNNEIDQDQQEPEMYPLLTSTFVQFHTQEATYMACQSLVQCAPLCIRSQYLEASPVDVKWKNLSMKWWRRYARTVLVVFSVAALILTWSVPVAFTGVVSQIAYLTAVWPSLHWVDALPAWLHSRCFTAGNSDCTYDVAAIRVAYLHQASGSADRGGRRAFSTEVLFHLFVCTSFPDGLSIFEHHGRCSKSTSRPRFCTGGASQKSSQGEQLFLFLFIVTMLLNKRKFSSSSGTTNRLVYSCPNYEHYAEGGMGEAERFASDAVGHPFPNLYQSSLHR